MRSTTLKALAIGAIGASVLIGIPAVACTPAAKADPTVTEDSPGWNCVTMGNHICGPTNDQGVAPGLYRGGELVKRWPTVTTCTTPPTVVGLITGTNHCRQEYADTTMALAIGWPVR